VPDDRKKKASGGNSGQGSFSSDQGSWPGLILSCGVSGQ
jgi:hypothetical protein